MSSDLLAEFDTFYKSPQDAQPQASKSFSFFDGTNSSSQSGQAQAKQPPAQITKQNDDIWGGMNSFTSPLTPAQGETPQEDLWGSFGITATPPRPTTNAAKPNYQGGNQFKNDTAQPNPGIMRRSTVELFNNNVHDTIEPPTTSKNHMSYSNPRPALPPSRGSSGGEILFDADQEADEDDEFGDFESVVTPSVSQPPPASHPLDDFFGSMDINTPPSKKRSNLTPTSPNLGTPLPYPQAPKSPSFQQRNPFPKVGLATQQVIKTKIEDKPKSASPLTAWPSYDEKPSQAAPYVDSPAALAIVEDIDDDWGDFSDLPAESPAIDNTKPISGIAANAWAWDAVDNVAEPTLAESKLPPPTNVPPPSILLALFPQLFDLPQSSLFKAVANQPFSLKNRIMSDPTTINFLRAYLLIATVAAHIIAGRKLRWKRDTHLSQGMSIGPAGGKGGMKLTGVDKAEIAREEREATETIRVWKEQLGRLRSAVAVANTSLKDVSKHLTIPEIGDTMHVKNQEGGLPAPKACVICGLKREERVTKIDVKVEDSFGEWWIEHWGHRLCRNFWQEHEGRLKFR
ncbi:hypothetical protein SBOR_1984 [Sclerotinia borealis F-4128]|uniref:Serine/threonine-protein kinase ppk6 n=1 Tax=Sclerotinia borealis (strain F-4128) TaxID=1432307 RepID=W9CP36_SCLBF|nr:hypothetical protein SBOR_1984 [Sclerotinia borealis F-4128]